MITTVGCVGGVLPLPDPCTPGVGLAWAGVFRAVAVLFHSWFTCTQVALGAFTLSAIRGDCPCSVKDMCP